MKAKVLLEFIEKYEKLIKGNGIDVKNIFEISDDIIELLLKENAQDDKVMFVINNYSVLSKNIIKCIICIKNDIRSKYLKKVAHDKNSLNSPYHEQDMKLIANAKSDQIAHYLSEVACDENSLNSSHHEEDMKLIANAKTDEIAGSLTEVACNKISLDSPYHEQDMRTIINECEMNESKQKLEKLRFVREELLNLLDQDEEVDMNADDFEKIWQKKITKNNK